MQLPDLENTIIFCGLDDAIIDFVTRDNKVLALYSEIKIIECLMKQGMDEEEAWDFYGYNIACLYTGEYTPLIRSELNRECFQYGDERPFECDFSDFDEECF